MSDKKFFKIKPGTDYAAVVKKYFTLKPQWSEVYPKVSELLGENITSLALTPKKLYIEPSEIKNPENKKLFNKDGSLKSNSKRAKQLLEDYKEIIAEIGLTDYLDLGTINFQFGIYRLNGETLRSYGTSDHEIYYEANFDLEERSKGLVIPITEVEYQEKYLEELKKQERAS